jgi:tRNA(Ile)-lysidine synthase
MRSARNDEPPLFTLEFTKALEGFPAAHRYLIGVSGGRDSVALLHLLVSLGFKKLIVCHLDHCLRGRASSGDARFVQRLADKLGAPAIIGKTDVARLADENRLSTETAARNARYEFFAKIAREKKCRTVFLAHHADDQVETFLFNLFRGAGSGGLGAMRFKTARVIGKTELRIVRPLLGIWRGEIDEYIRANRLRFREDATNQSLENTRSVMRHRILPMIARNFGRDVRLALWRAAEIFAAQNDCLKASLHFDSAELSVADLRALPDALQRFAIHQWLRQHAVREVGFALVETIRELLPPESRKAKANLPGARHVRRREKKLFIE